MNDLTPVRFSGIPNVVKDYLVGSDKIFIVPVGKFYYVWAIAADLTASAVVGNRVFRVQHRDGTGAVLYQGPSSTVLTATQAQSVYMGHGESYSTASRRGPSDRAPTNSVSSGMPVLFMDSPDYIRIYDAAAIDPAADEVNYVIYYWEVNK